MRRGNLFIGALLIICGCIMLFARYVLGYELISLKRGDFWPFIVLAAGMTFELLYFSTRKYSGFLVPGGILTTIGLLFLFEVATDWRFAAYTWPFYIIAPAVGLFQLYLFTGRPKGLLIASSIVGGVGVLALALIIFELFVSVVDVALVIPFVLIGIGALLVLRRSPDRNGY